MVNSQALRLVPISKLDCLAQAFITVSCTRSSALSCLPESDTAKARRLGSVASSSRLNEDVSSGALGFVAGLIAFDCGIGSLLRLIQLFEEVEELVGDALVLNGAIERAQLGSDVGIGAKPVVGPPHPAGGHFVHRLLVSHCSARIRQGFLRAGCGGTRWRRKKFQTAAEPLDCDSVLQQLSLSYKRHLGRFLEMTLASRIAPHLPYLRRFSRATTGSQTSGDAYVAATLEALIADT